VRVALLQIDPTAGDTHGNATLIVRGARDAPPLLVGVATRNPADLGRPLFSSAVLLKNGEVGLGAPGGRQ